MVILALTDKGTIRSQNQDYFSYKIHNSNLCYAVVCDGMGGAKAGDVASKIACKYIGDRLDYSFRDTNIKEIDIKNIMQSAISVANIKVYNLAQENEEYYGMGTTVSVAIIKDNKVYIGNAGDSRIYSVDNNGIEQLTTDHTLVQSLLDSGAITKEEAEKHPQKHYITRSLGVYPILNIDYSEYLIDDKIILMCTDGFSNYIDETNLFKLIEESLANKSVSNLIVYANECGGKDNITALVIAGGKYNG